MIGIYARLFIIYMLGACLSVECLQCRNGDGSSDAELKRVARSCMRRMGELEQTHGTAGHRFSGGNTFGQYPYTRQQQYEEQQRYNNNNNGNNNNHNNNNNNRDERYDYTDYSAQDNHHDNYATRDSLMLQRNRAHARNIAGTHLTNNGAANSGGNNQRHQHSGTNSNHKNHNDTDTGCIAHCFFDEMNMLNSDGYPERQKLNYMLTKDIRERELRNFYTDTIQQCFRYLETQRRRDRCQYARDLIKCMSEYAKANCDDWDEYTKLIFN